MYVQPKMVKCQFFFRFFPQQQFNRQFSFRVEVLNPMGWYLGHKGLLAPPPPSQCAHVACFCTFFKIFHVRLGKKTKTVSFYSGVCMCKGKTNTCQVFFFNFFFLHLSLIDIFFHEIKARAEEGKVRLLLLKPGCHQRVTLVGSCYKVPSNRSMSKQEMDISNRKKDIFRLV